MGYRSDVILAIGPEVMPQFMVTMAKSPKARELCWSDHDEMIKTMMTEGRVSIPLDGIKWYIYESSHSRFIDWCENEPLRRGKEVDAYDFYRFIRIGEEMDDNESQGWGFDIHIERSAAY